MEKDAFVNTVNATLKRFQSLGVSPGPECYTEILDSYLQKEMVRFPKKKKKKKLFA
jgi:hypothetical protein